MHLSDENELLSTASTIDSESTTSISDNSESAVETVEIDEGPTENEQLSTAPAIGSESTTSISDSSESAVETVKIDEGPNENEQLSTAPAIDSESTTSISDSSESAVETVEIEEGPAENEQLSTAPAIDFESATSISDNAESAVETVEIDIGPNLEEFKAGIEADCSPESLNTLEGIEQCYNKCAAHLCCVSAKGLGSDFNCSNAYPDECKVYQVCEQLVSRYGTWSPPTTSFDPYAVKKVVNDACIPPDNALVTREWVSNCHMVCEARMCCLAHSSLGSSCIEDLGEDVCNDYSACQNLIGGDLRDSVSINDMCNNDVTSNKELFLECREKCTQRSCCFEDNPTSSCYEMVRYYSHMTIGSGQFVFLSCK
jgi:hypothetical protein